MNELSEKHEAIRDVVRAMRTELGSTAFDIADHWEMDRCAIGLCNRSDASRLVYICTFRLPRDKYDVDLDVASSVDDDVPYMTVDSYRKVTFDELVEIVRKHLLLPSE